MLVCFFLVRTGVNTQTQETSFVLCTTSVQCSVLTFVFLENCADFWVNDEVLSTGRSTTWGSKPSARSQSKSWRQIAGSIHSPHWARGSYHCLWIVRAPIEKQNSAAKNVPLAIGILRMYLLFYLCHSVCVIWGIVESCFLFTLFM